MYRSVLNTNDIKNVIRVIGLNNHLFEKKDLISSHKLYKRNLKKSNLAS